MLAHVRFDDSLPGKSIVRAVVHGLNPPSPEQVAAIEAKLPKPPDEATVELRIRFLQTKIITRNGHLYQDVEFGTAE